MSGHCPIPRDALSREALSSVSRPCLAVSKGKTVAEAQALFQEFHEIEIGDAADVIVRMTLTSPACPVAESLPGEVRNCVAQVEGVESVDVDLVWNPPWTPDRISEAARLQLGMM